MVEQLQRLQTGIAGMDAILKGGLVAGASYIVQGRPGSGKTILANQIAFHHASAGHKVLFATLLAENHDRLFQFLSTLSFFDRARIGAEIHFVSAFDTMAEEGLDEVVTLLRREIGRQDASLLVVDGLLNARSQAETTLDTKHFIASLQGHAAFAGCTVLFLTSSRLDDGSPEHTMVDGIIELAEELTGGRSVRRMQLRKSRGTGTLSGLHAMEITPDGIIVHPRLEAILNHPSVEDHAGRAISRVPSGIPTLDEMLGGGLPGASSTLVMGPSGCGKTTMGIAFLRQCTPEQPGVLFGLYEPPSRLLLKSQSLGMDLEPLLASGALTIVWQPATEGLIDALGHRLLDTVARTGAKRVFIDSLSALSRTATLPNRSMNFFTALMNELRATDVTTLSSWEMRDLFGTDIQAPAPELSSIVDNLLMMRFVELRAELRRVLSVLKIRDSTYDPSLREFVIQDGEVVLTRAFEQIATVMSGSAQPSPRR